MIKLINRQFSWLGASANLHTSIGKFRIGLDVSPTKFESSIPIFRKLFEILSANPSNRVLKVYSWSAVVRGAVLHVVEGIVHTRKLKQHYGIIRMKKFQPGVHNEEDSYTDPFDDIKFTEDNVDWLAGKVWARFCCLTRCKVEQKIGRRR